MELTKQIKNRLKNWIPPVIEYPEYNEDAFIEKWWKEHSDVVEPHDEEWRESTGIFSEHNYEDIDTLIGELQALKSQGFTVVCLDYEDVLAVRSAKEDITDPDSVYYSRVADAVWKDMQDEIRAYGEGCRRKRRITELEAELALLRAQEKRSTK